MEHDINLVLQVVGIGVIGVAAPILDQVVHGGGARLLPWGGVKVNGLPRADFLEAAFRPPAVVPFFFGTVLGIENGRCWRQRRLCWLQHCPCQWQWWRRPSSSLESSLLESSSFSVINIWKEEGGIRCNVKKQ